MFYISVIDNKFHKKAQKQKAYFEHRETNSHPHRTLFQKIYEW